MATRLLFVQKQKDSSLLELVKSKNALHVEEPAALGLIEFIRKQAAYEAGILSTNKQQRRK